MPDADILIRLMLSLDQSLAPREFVRSTSHTMLNAIAAEAASSAARRGRTVAVGVKHRRAWLGHGTPPSLVGKP